MKNLLTLLLCFTITQAYTQSIANVTFKQEDETVRITYDIQNVQDGQTFDITLHYSTDAGRTYSNALKAVSGDIGEKVKGGYSKNIIWKPLEENLTSLESDAITFKVIGQFIDEKKEAKRRADAYAKKRAYADAKKRAYAERKERLAKSTTGSSYDIKGRAMIARPAPPTNPGINGRVVIKICIDNKGQVVSATFTQKGSTITDKEVISTAIWNAEKYRFDSNPMAADKECGTITYGYKTP